MASNGTARFWRDIVLADDQTPGWHVLRPGPSITLHRLAALLKVRFSFQVTKQIDASRLDICEHLGPNSTTHWFKRLYRTLGFDGCSSHSGRRTFITGAARKVSEAGGSLRDVKQLAGHASLQTNQRYVEGSTEAKRRPIAIF